MTDNLFQIQDKNFWNNIDERHKETGGVYKLIAFKDGQRMPVNRFLNRDEDGVLYIGKATSFVDRVTVLKKSIAPDYKGKGHDCGIRYKKYKEIAIMVPYDNLYIELVPSDSPKERERVLLEEYLEKYGELPPFNAF